MWLENIIKNHDCQDMNRKSMKPDANVFESAVNSIEDLKGGYRKGLQALKSDSPKVSISDCKNLLGSVDIDACTKSFYPQDSRWDFAIGYNQKAWFVEVHPANTSNVKEMVKKVQWLESWLVEKGKGLAIIRNDNVHYWIPSGRVCVLKTSRQYKCLAKHRIKLTANPFVIK